MASGIFCFLSLSVCFGLKSSHNSYLPNTDSATVGFLQLLYGTSYDICGDDALMEDPRGTME